MLSVIICTHNPREDFLRRTLNSLREQSISKDHWELILVDNASAESLASQWDLGWHPQGRHVREERLGLSAARLAGIRESKGQLLVFVDDDNLLEKDYLMKALEIADQFPFLGVWGGAISPLFENNPPVWFERYKLCYACVDVAEDRWSNLRFEYSTVPAGAGMCVRRQVAIKYVERLDTEPIRLMLGRKGQSLTSGEDTDLALTACDLGFGTGQFTRLRMRHLIPSERMTIEYLERLTEGIAFSSVIAESIRGKATPFRPSCGTRAFLGRLRRRLFWSPLDRKIFEASMRGRDGAIKLLQENSRRSD